MKKVRIVILGGGFAGLKVARELRSIDADITLIDRSNYHLFQPLLYQVATAGLSPGDIAAPIRVVLKSKNTEILMSEIVGIDRSNKEVLLSSGGPIGYDVLVVATGARHSYFGHDEWEAEARGLKSIPDATEIRKRILLSFESAEICESDADRAKYLTMVIVGAGPTGCEMAGSIAEMTRKALTSDFRHFDPAATRILLIEAGERILAGFPAELAEKAAAELRRLGATIMTGSRVEDVNSDGVVVSGEPIASKTIVWAAGVTASPAGKWLGVKTDREGRVEVGSDLKLPGDPSVYVIGDTARVLDANGAPLPGVATVALQEGQYVAKSIRAELQGAPIQKGFTYFEKGSLAAIGRRFAILHRGKIQLSGALAWFVWLFVHIAYLIGFRNKLLVITQWAWAYLTYQRGVRLIVEEPEIGGKTRQISENVNEEKAL